MKKISVLLVVLLLSITCLSCSKEEKEKAPAEPQMAMAADGGFALEVGQIKLHWSVANDNINIKLSAPTTGWVGIGFNPSAEMKDANFIVGYVKDGVLKVSDHHGSAKNQHKEDAVLGGTDNVSGAAGTEKNGVTEISFSLMLQTGDSLDGTLQPATDNVVLLAYGKTDRLVQQHVLRAKLKLNFSTGKYQVLLLKK